jgi:predicted AlkP superfamily phosphohydrolase/phosphomutase
MESLTKVLFLEMDAGEKTLIRDWAAAGLLPTFRSLLAKGLVGDTMAPEGFYVGSIWPSLCTGVTPARHGIHGWGQVRPGSYEVHLFYTDKDLKREPFWNDLNRAGRKVAILDIPLAGISKDLNGIQMVEWGGHDYFRGFGTWPPSLARQVKARFGLHPLRIPCNASNRTPEDFAFFTDQLVEGIKKKTELTKYYLNQGGWDFFAQVFTESHCVGHQCWHLHDPNHPGHDPAIVAVTGDPVRDVYVAIDAAIGEILADVGEDTVVVVLAGHGMGYKCGAQFLLPEILVRLGVAQPPSPESSRWAKPDSIDRLDAFLTWGWQRTPVAIKERLQPIRRRLRDAIDLRDRPLPMRLDPRGGKCFLVDNGFMVGGIRVNLRGREPGGVVEPGSGMDAFCDELARDLLDITDLDTGKPIVKRVVRTRDLYQGEYIDRLPDLLVEWSDEKPLGSATCGNPGGSRLRLRSDKLGVIEGVNHYCRTGDHRPHGLFMAFGPGIEQGKLNGTICITDFAPTFTQLLGVDLCDVDGKPIADLLKARVGDETATVP